MIKILQLTSLKCGGAESVLMNYYRAIDRNKIQFDFLIFSNSQEFYEEEVTLLGGTIYKANPNNRLRDGYKLLKELASTKDYKAIEIHTENAHSVIWVVMAYLSGFKKVIVHSHSTNNVKIVEHRIAKIFLNLFPIIRFSCGEAAAEFMFGKNAAYIVNNAIDIDRYKYNEKTRNLIRDKYHLNDTLVLGHIGRFIELKNHGLLLHICKCLKEKGYNVKLLLVGDGELKEHVEKQTSEMSLQEQVVFTGNVRNVNEYLQAMDLFLLPSYYEGFPTVAVEAQASGLRCVLSDTITKSINITGLVSFFDINKSPEEWANLIIKKTNYQRSDMREKIRNSGFGIKTEAKNLYEVYQMIGDSRNNECASIYNFNNRD